MASSSSLTFLVSSSPPPAPLFYSLFCILTESAVRRSIPSESVDAFCLEVAVCSSLGNRSNGATLPGVTSSPLNLLLMIQPGQTVARFRLRQLTSAASQARTSTNDGSGPILLSHGRYRSLRLAQDVASRTCRTNRMPDAERTFHVPGHRPDRPDAVHLVRRDLGFV